MRNNLLLTKKIHECYFLPVIKLLQCDFETKTVFCYPFYPKGLPDKIFSKLPNKFSQLSLMIIFPNGAFLPFLQLLPIKQFGLTIKEYQSELHLNVKK